MFYNIRLETILKKIYVYKNIRMTNNKKNKIKFLYKKFQINFKILLK